MQAIDIAGQLLFRQITKPIVEKYIGENESLGDTKLMIDDYLI